MWISDGNFKSTKMFVRELVFIVFYFGLKIRMLNFSDRFSPENVWGPTCWTAFVTESNALKAKLCRLTVGFRAQLCRLQS